ncbi:MAG: B12-binding domain-containing radical SAM protein [bacterium]
MRILLLTLPFFHPAEPPGQLALLKSLWQQDQQEHTVLAFDANLDFLDYVLSIEYVLECLAAFSTMGAPSSRWTRARRAYLHLDRARAALKSEEGYRSFSRYLTFVHHLNDALKLVFAPYPDMAVSLNNFQLLPYAAVDMANNLRSARQTNCSPFDDWCSERLFPRVEQYRPDLIAFSLTYLSQLFPTLFVAARLKTRFPKIPAIIGGGLINCYRDRPRSLSLLSGLFDRIVLGRAAESGPMWPAVLRQSAAKSPFIETPDLLPHLPAPDYGDFNLSGYFSPVPVLPYATSLGCYWNRCAFCPDAGRSPHTSGSKDLARNLQKTLEDHPGALFHFTDPAVPPANMEIIADLFAGRNVTYYSFVRFEACFEDAAFMKHLSSSGCRMLQFGLESASERLLALSRKGIDLQRAERILELSARENILNYVYLLFGLPSETDHDRRKTLDFIARNQSVVHFINPALMNLPIGSPMERDPGRFLIDRTYELAATGPDCEEYDKGQGDSRKQDDGSQAYEPGNDQDEDEGEAGCSFSLYKGFISQGENIRPSARHFLEKVFSPHPLVAPILQHDPPFFRAAHAPFFGLARKRGR